VWRAWGDSASYVARGHDDRVDVERYSDAHVVFADISADNETLLELGLEAKRLLVLDHHVSALRRFEADAALAGELSSRGHRIHFDLSRSGAVLAWQEFHPGIEPPDLLRYVEDQDLWRFALPGSEEVNAAIASHPRTFETWESLARRPARDLADEGAPVLRAWRTEVARALRHTHPVRVGRHRLEAVNAVQLRSRIGHELAQRARFDLPCGAVYRLTGDRVEVSLYSLGELDVSEIAAGFGGGGHRNAAGFSVRLEEWLRRFL